MSTQNHDFPMNKFTYCSNTMFFLYLLLINEHVMYNFPQWLTVSGVISNTIWQLSPVYTIGGELFCRLTEPYYKTVLGHEQNGLFTEGHIKCCRILPSYSSSSSSSSGATMFIRQSTSVAGPAPWVMFRPGICNCTGYNGNKNTLAWVRNNTYTHVYLVQLSRCPHSV